MDRVGTNAGERLEERNEGVNSDYEIEREMRTMLEGYDLGKEDRDDSIVEFERLTNIRG